MNAIPPRIATTKWKMHGYCDEMSQRVSIMEHIFISAVIHDTPTDVICVGDTRTMYGLNMHPLAVHPVVATVVLQNAENLSEREH